MNSYFRLKHLFNNIIIYQVLTSMLTPSVRFLAFIDVDASRLRPILEPPKTWVAIAGEPERRFLLFDVSTRSVRRTPSWVFFALLNDVFNDVVVSTSFRSFVVDSVVASTLTGVRSFSVDTPVKNLVIKDLKVLLRHFLLNSKIVYIF